FGSPLKYLGLAFVVELALLYLTAAVALRDEWDWAALAAALGVALLIAIAYALVQRAGLDPLAWSSDPTGRPFGTVGNADVLGHVLSVGIAAAGGTALLYRGRYPWYAGGAALIVVVAG